jgi:hypothetical protein
MAGERGLAARVADLERRMTAVESRERVDAIEPPGGEQADRFWALNGLKSRTAGASAVLFTGRVGLPDGREYEWQQGADVGAMLNADWEAAAAPLAALGHRVRLTLLQEVLAGRCTSAELAAVEGLGTTGQLYHHIRELVASGWLRSITRGRYEVPPNRVVALLVILTAADR